MSKITVKVGVRQDLLKVGSPLRAIDGTPVGIITNVKFLTDAESEVEVELDGVIDHKPVGYSVSGEGGSDV